MTFSVEMEFDSAEFMPIECLYFNVDCENGGNLSSDLLQFSGWSIVQGAAHGGAVHCAPYSITGFFAFALFPAVITSSVHTFFLPKKQFTAHVSIRPLNRFWIFLFLAFVHTHAYSYSRRAEPCTEMTEDLLFISIKLMTIGFCLIVYNVDLRLQFRRMFLILHRSSYASIFTIHVCMLGPFSFSVEISWDMVKKPTCLSLKHIIYKRVTCRVQHWNDISSLCFISIWFFCFFLSHSLPIAFLFDKLHPALGANLFDAIVFPLVSYLSYPPRPNIQIA